MRSQSVGSSLKFNDDRDILYTNPDGDSRGPWKALPAHAKAGKGRRASQYYEIELPSGRRVNPPPGRCWLYTQERLKDMKSEGRIWFGRDGNAMPAIKRFLTEVPAGLVPTTIWHYDEAGTTSDAKNEIVTLFPDNVPFATPKPEKLIARVIQIASNPGDIVLDCFIGSGTTAAVAHKLDRRWVGIEWSADTIATFTRPRLEKVVRGEDPGGITEPVAWEGGGGFRVLDVAPSMFSAEEGIVYLAEWAISSALAEATAAQLGYEYAPDLPFCGHKGRTKLAVIDGLVNVDVARLLAERLEERQRVLVCATAVDDEAATFLRDARRGSVRKIPAAILRYYERPSRLRSLLEVAPVEGADRTIPASEVVA